MLFLQPPAGATGEVPAAMPIADATGLAFERAFLSADDSSRLREVSAALSADRNAGSWAMRVAEMRLGRTVNRVEEAAEWLATVLVRELAAALTSDGLAAPSNEIGWRLPLLAARLFGVEQSLADFDRRLEQEKLESLKELAYGASHEINNPLANIAARAQTLLEDETDSERQRKLAAIHRQAMRAHEMISDLMLFARPPKLKRADCDLQSLVKKVVGESAELAEEYGIELVYDDDSDVIHLRADETQLGVAIGALVKNALESVSEGGHVQVAARRSTIGSAAFAEVVVRDDGPGISAEVRQHMFDPFYSGREAGRGLGFGASKCWRIVTDHGGQVIVHSRGPSGAEISILLPLGEVSPADAIQR